MLANQEVKAVARLAQHLLEDLAVMRSIDKPMPLVDGIQPVAQSGELHPVHMLTLGRRERLDLPTLHQLQVRPRLLEVRRPPRRSPHARIDPYPSQDLVPETDEGGPQERERPQTLGLSINRRAVKRSRISCRSVRSPAELL